ncbi:hypothetical protein RJ641_033515 [Dillenia turbinata]|uniref:GDSL esterase/lipase n=1 Tax=Dillenia turbinata TaxID=194707 RepID=A0AAN8VLZ8_9MAGN
MKLQCSSIISSKPHPKGYEISFQDSIRSSLTSISPYFDIVMKPSDIGKWLRKFPEFLLLLLILSKFRLGSLKACHGTGLLETSYVSNADSPGTCANATKYVLWDGFHPTETVKDPG